MTQVTDVYYDPYDVEISADPYPVFRRLRDEAPLYYNDQHDFYAVSLYDDVQRALGDPGAFISSRGGILELIKADMEMPPGTLIFEDPPIHTIHRRLLSRVFTPKRVAALEPQIREFCARSLDPLLGNSGFDFVADLGAQMPMRVISMLLGIPEPDQEAVRDRVDANLRTNPGEPMQVEANFAHGEIFGEYIEWRAEHPSDDLMTELLNAEFEDETGTTRRLTRDEVLTYTFVVAGAGNETTTRLIGWAGKVLARSGYRVSSLSRAWQEARRCSTSRGSWSSTLSPRTPRPSATASIRPSAGCGSRSTIWRATPSSVGGRFRPEAPCSSSSARPTATTAATPTATASTSAATWASTSRSATASISVWVRRWPGSRGGSPSTRS